MKEPLAFTLADVLIVLFSIAAGIIIGYIRGRIVGHGISNTAWKDAIRRHKRSRTEVQS